MGRKNVDLSQTIYSLASGSLPAAVAIERLSGPHAFSIAEKIFRPAGEVSLPRRRGLFLGTLHSEEEKIDEILLLTFVGPESFTGEDVIEFQCHGSFPIINRLESLLNQAGARRAEAGEFSYRAHVNGKLSAEDLENLGDVFLARQPADLTRIYSRRDGALQTQVDSLRTDLVSLQAIFDTAVDFSEEYSSAIQLAAPVIDRVTRGCSQIIQRYSAFRTGSAAKRLVLAGLPNAGKSSLFNALLCRYRAIVHESPGTTTDVIEEDVTFSGGNWKLVDTAGFRKANLAKEREGIDLGRDFLSSADFWILVVDGTKPFPLECRSLMDSFAHIPHLVVWNKKDSSDWCPPFSEAMDWIGVSAQTGENLGFLWNELRERIKCLDLPVDGPLPSSVHCARIQRLLDRIGSFQSMVSASVPAEYLAEENRRILTDMETVIGEVSTEDVLDRVFTEFCIGK